MIKRLGWRGYAIIGAALAYIVFPADALPDFIPLVGWLDDVLAGAIAAYAVWKRLTPKKGEPR